MSEPTDVVVLVGSLRKASLNLKIAKTLCTLAPGSLQLEIVPIGNLALYNEELDVAPPESWRVFRERVGRARAVLFVTPEYNRSVPGVLKNAIDVGSRPYGHSVWSGKPAAVISASPGALGGFGANHHLRQSLVFLDMPVLQQPEAYLGHVGDWFDANDAIVNEKGRQFLQQIVSAYAAWIERVAQ
jgi:chromate reductase